MNSTANQDSASNALRSACSTFRGTISADSYKDYIPMAVRAVRLKHKAELVALEQLSDGYPKELGHV